MFSPPVDRARLCLCLSLGRPKEDELQKLKPFKTKMNHKIRKLMKSRAMESPWVGPGLQRKAKSRNLLWGPMQRGSGCPHQASQHCDLGLSPPSALPVWPTCDPPSSHTSHAASSRRPSPDLARVPSWTPTASDHAKNHCEMTKVSLLPPDGEA